VLRECEVFANGLANVEIKEGGDPNLHRCVIRDGRVCGVLVWVSATGLFEECEVRGNTYAGVEVKQGGQPTFLRCKVGHNGGSAFYVHEQGTATIEGCDLRGNKLGPWDLGPGCRVRRNGNIE
jgi:F-box protein 11